MPNRQSSEATWFYKTCYSTYKQTDSASWERGRRNAIKLKCAAADERRSRLRKEQHWTYNAGHCSCRLPACIFACTVERAIEEVVRAYLALEIVYVLCSYVITGWLAVRTPPWNFAKRVKFAKKQLPNSDVNFRTRLEYHHEYDSPPYISGKKTAFRGSIQLGPKNGPKNGPKYSLQKWPQNPNFL